MTDPADPADTETAGPEGPEGPTRCGFVALVGAPNAGKSTLLNTLVGEKVAIVTPKVQTTRNRILGIAIEGTAQMVFVDLPGIFTPKRRLERAMVAAAWQGAQDADLAVLVVDAAQRNPDEDTRAIAARLAEAGRPAMLALNKVDAAPHGRLLPFADELNRLAPFSDTFMISALTGDGVRDLRRIVAARLPEGPWLYPEDEITDMPMRLMAAEVTREKAFLNLRAELPYAVAVETESWEEFRDGSVRISQVIYVQRNSQKAIVLGRGGQMIRAIGAAARQELEQALERRVHLNLFVKVRDWLENPELYRPWGLDFNA